jgi:CheY-like chemotaxis protein
VLAFHGYRLAEAETGEDGVRLARELRPQLVLMDIQLPGIDGIAALGQLRSDPATRAIPVIAVTASAMTHDRQKIMAAGFDGYQSKPIRVREFVDAVRQALEPS